MSSTLEACSYSTLKISQRTNFSPSLSTCPTPSQPVLYSVPWWVAPSFTHVFSHKSGSFQCLFLSKPSYLVITSCPFHHVSLLNLPCLSISVASALVKGLAFSHRLYCHRTLLNLLQLYSQSALCKMQSYHIAMKLSLSMLRLFPAPTSLPAR